MERYAPIFSRIVDSSLWVEPDYVVKIFLTLLAKKDADEIVRGSAFNIACWAKKTEAEVLDALKILSAPDTKRLEPQPFEGRRIEKVEGGWMLLNGGKYQEEMMIINRRRRKTQLQAIYRAEAAQANPVPETPEQGAVPVFQQMAESAKGDGRFKAPELVDVKALMMEKGWPADRAGVEAEKFIAFYESKGWMVGKNKMKSWASAAAGWMARNHEAPGAKGPTGLSPEGMTWEEQKDMDEIRREIRRGAV